MSGGTDNNFGADDPDDRDGLAAEYVLGTLDAVERAVVASRLDVDPPLADAVARWEALLAPLTLGVPDARVPTHVWQGLEARLEAVAALRLVAGRRASSPAASSRGVGAWRGLALAASLAALVFGGLFARTLIAPPAPELVAVLQSDGKAPGFLVRVDVANRQLVVQRVAAPHEAGRAHELWLVAGAAAKPVSLGVIGEDRPSRAALGAIAPADVENATYAVSLEPAGGSTTGGPTGPVVFSGKLIVPDAADLRP